MSKILWEGKIPVVKSFNMDTFFGYAVARDINGRAEIVIRCPTEHAEELRDWLHDGQIPTCLSWVTRILDNEVYDKVMASRQPFPQVIFGWGPWGGISLFLPDESEIDFYVSENPDIIYFFAEIHSV